MEKFAVTAPLTIQTHLGNPKMARIPELTIRAMPECEGGGWFMPTEQAEALVAVWNGFVDMSPEPRAPLPTWAQLSAYWKDRFETLANGPTEAMEQAAFAALDEYDRWKAERKFPRPSLPAHIYQKMIQAA